MKALFWRSVRASSNPAIFRRDGFLQPAGAGEERFIIVVMKLSAVIKCLTGRKRRLGNGK
jgi:hypothetical protein